MTSTFTTELALPAEVQDLLFREARTVNNFSDEPVTDEQLRAVYDLVKWAPTSMNAQPLRAVVLRSEEARARLIPHLSPGNQAKTASAPLTVILAADLEFHENLPVMFPHVPGVRDALHGNEEERLKTANLNTALQIGYFIIGVRAAGLSAGPMTGFDNAGVDAEFFAGRQVHSQVVVNLGQPGENPYFDRLPRLDYDEVVETL